MFATAFLIPALLALAPAQPIDDERALHDFLASVHGYAALHRQAYAALPVEGPCRGSEQLVQRREQLAATVGAMRPGAREGDIFRDDVAVVIRRRLADALRKMHLRPADVQASAPDRTSIPSLEVNEFFPWDAGPPRWREVFWRLPALPEELEYRLVGTDLVLLDAGARVVVDVLRQAVRRVPAVGDGHDHAGVRPDDPHDGPRHPHHTGDRGLRHPMKQD